jgi:pimeloyl-ACP methyl ester carboxylesterase
MLATPLLALVIALPQSKPAKGADAFAGRWMTSFGPLELEAKGKGLAGSYGWKPESKIEGKRVGEAFEFEWSGPNGSGDGRFTLWKDGRTFLGESTFGQGQKEFWGGYRIERKRAEPVKGAVSDGQTEMHLEYHVRVPKDFDPKKRYTAVALFHGSNANSREYVEGFPSNWPELAERYILVGFDGEHLSSGSQDPRRVFNATYVEFSGDKVGEPWRYLQTPALVADALKELSSELPIERWYVGGHSQGGFLTFAVAMFYPELVAGAFPVAGNLLVQCEPSFFEDEKVRAAQRRVPFAIVHGEKDTVVEFSSGLYCRDALQDGGFPALRLFTDPKAGHPWAFLPVDDALAWLDAMNGTDPEELLAFARKSADEKHYRDASAALERLPKRAGAEAESAAKLREELEKAAEPERTRLAKAIGVNKNGDWVDAFWDFRAEFALLPGSQSLMAAYDKLRAKHQKPADQLFYRARGETDAAKKKELYRELVEKHYASSWYRLVKSWSQ